MKFRYLIASLEDVIVMGTNDIDVANKYVETSDSYVVMDAQDGTFVDESGEQIKIKEAV